MAKNKTPCIRVTSGCQNARKKGSRFCSITCAALVGELMLNIADVWFCRKCRGWCCDHETFKGRCGGCGKKWHPSEKFNTKSLVHQRAGTEDPNG